MTEAKIKTPVYFDLDERMVLDAENGIVCEVDIDGVKDDADVAALGNQIADALNRHSELEAEVKVLREAVEHYADKDYWHSTHNLGRQYVYNGITKKGKKLNGYDVAQKALAAADTARGDDDGK